MRAEPGFGPPGVDVLDAPAVDEDAEAPAAVRALDDGRAFTLIVEPDPDASARLVGDVERTLAARGVPVTVVRNSTPWPLTRDKLIAQVGGEPGSDPEQLLREAMAGPFHDQGRAVLVIDQADTLDGRAMTFLSDLSKALRASGSEFQVVFVGRETLARKLRAHGFGAPAWGGATRVRLVAVGALCVAAVALAWLLLADREPQVARQAPPAAAAAQTLASQPAEPQPLPLQPSSPQPTIASGDPAAATPPIAPAPTPAPAAVAPPSPVLQPDAELPSASVEEREAALRRDFGAFLDRSGTQTANLTPAQRDALFKDYLVWRLRPGGPSPAPSAAAP